MTDSVRTINRRTITKGVAWATPFVAVALPAPSAATTPPCVPELTFDLQKSCKCPGQSTNFNYGYFLSICVEDVNHCIPSGGAGGPVVYVQGVQNNSGVVLTAQPMNPDWCGSMLPFPITVDPVTGKSCSPVLRLGPVPGSGSSAGKLKVTYSFSPNGPTQTATIDAPPDCPSSGTTGMCYENTPC